jgi:energy-converting hydrogenase Eha subunit A
MFVTVIVLVVVIVAVVVAGLLHLPRMTRKPPCSTSTPAIRALLQKPRRPKPLQRAG